MSCRLLVRGRLDLGLAQGLQVSPAVAPVGEAARWAAAATPVSTTVSLGSSSQGSSPTEGQTALQRTNASTQLENASAERERGARDGWRPSAARLPMSSKTDHMTASGVVEKPFVLQQISQNTAKMSTGVAMTPSVLV